MKIKRTLKVLILLLIATISLYSQTIRKPVAGKFYPANKDSLELTLKGYLKQAKEIDINGQIKALVVPHFWPYAFQTAAEAFKQIEGHEIKNIVILCNSHRGFFDGIAIDSSDIWETPLGQIHVNKDIANNLIKEDNRIRYNSAPHITDHTIENILPFLQISVKTDFKIVPILFGNSFYITKDRNNDYKLLADLLAKYLGPNDLLIVSNDMSHYYADKKVTQKMDSTTLNILEELDNGKLQLYEDQLSELPSSKGKILSCAIDGLKTTIEYMNLIGGGSVNELDHGITTEFDNNVYVYVGYSSVIMTNYKH